MGKISGLAGQISQACPGMLVRQASRFLTSVFDEAFRPLGIQASQGYVLVTIATFGEDGATISAIADALIMDRTTLTRNVRPLEKTGLVRVARSPDDARSRILFLTHAGERMIERMPRVWEKAVERLREAFGPTCVQSLQSQLADFVAAVSRARTRKAVERRTTATTRRVPLQRGQVRTSAWNVRLRSSAQGMGRRG